MPDFVYKSVGPGWQVTVRDGPWSDEHTPRTFPCVQDGCCTGIVKKSGVMCGDTMEAPCIINLSVDES